MEDEQALELNIDDDIAIVREGSDTAPNAQTLTREEFAVEWKKIEPKLIIRALSLTRKMVDANDLVQSTAVKAWEKIAQFRKGTLFQAWVQRILINTFKNEYRRRKQLGEITDRVKAGYYEIWRNQDDGTQPEWHVLDRILPNEIKEALEQLPVDFRMPVVLCDLQDFSYKEVATIMDSPLGTVISRLFRGRKLLRKKLAEFALEEYGLINRKTDNDSEAEETA